MEPKHIPDGNIMNTMPMVTVFIQRSPTDTKCGTSTMPMENAFMIKIPMDAIGGSNMIPKETRFI